MNTWTTKDGIKLNIKDMETTHIQNCLNQLNKTHGSLATELAGIGEYGFHFTEFQLQEDLEKVEKKIKMFKKELKSRQRIYMFMPTRHKRNDKTIWFTC